MPLAIVAIGCAAMHGGSGMASAPTGDILFAASSMPSAYGIQMRLEGSAAVRGDWLYIVVPTGLVRTYQGTADAWDLMLRAGLATCSGTGKWRLVSESRAARIAPLVGLTREHAMLDTTVRAFNDTLRLDLGVPQGTKLDRAWLTFELAWPIEGVLATYTLPGNSSLATPTRRWETGAQRPADVLCGS
ncbi:MAG TPA: hypothetical protein VFW98_05840 [Gemmatimonadaceae bacterium]|nr:hypothetical protein [Gemmatimonadaceae bacterium]